MNNKLDILHTLYIHNTCCRSSDVVCYLLRLCYLHLFIRLYISSDRDFFIFYLLEVQNATQPLFGIALSKYKSKSVQKVNIKRLTRSLRINSNGLFPPRPQWIWRFCGHSQQCRPSLWKSVVTSNCLITNILQNTIFYIQLKKETGLEQHEVE